MDAGLAAWRPGSSVEKSSMARRTFAWETPGPWNWIAVCSVPSNWAVQSQIFCATSPEVPIAKLSRSAISSNCALSGPPVHSSLR